MNKKKLLVIISIVVVLVVFLTVYLVFGRKKDKVLDKSLYTQVYFYDLGKSQIEIIRKDEYTVLVNTGLLEDRDNLLDYFDKLEISKIDYLILTNRDDKYIANASFILNNYNVDYVYYNDFSYTSDTITELENTLNNNHAIGVELGYNEEIKLNDLIINIYPSTDNTNMTDSSLVIRIKTSNNSIYLTDNVSKSKLEDLEESTLLVSENSSLYDINSEYYLYDGTEKIKSRDNLLKRNKEILMKDKEFIIN